MRDLWKAWYGDLTQDSEPQPYGDTPSYALGAYWLRECATVEDWGCGLGWARQFYKEGQYRGLDGTASPFADVVVDLRDYQSNVPGIFMRHVLEHNRGWQQVLDNAVASFYKRMVLALFTPMSDQTHEMPKFHNQGGIMVPAISFKAEDLEEHFGTAIWHHEDLHNVNTITGFERVYFLEKS